jgi:hypothetical protein
VRLGRQVEIVFSSPRGKFHMEADNLTHRRNFLHQQKELREGKSAIAANKIAFEDL